MRSSTYQRRKKIVKQDEEDRISNLPSCLISHIISLLPAKDAVATSVLSTKWKDFWILTTNLKFDDELRRSLSKKKSLLLQQSFTNFVYRVLLHCQLSCLRKFDLKCREGFDVSHINSWVSSVLEHKVPELRLCVHIQSSAQLPRKLFTCNTLVELELAGGFVMNPPESVLLQSLKVLDIDGVKFMDDGSIARLLSGCPMLGNLRMSDCIGKDVQVVKISAPLLTNLVLCGLQHGGCSPSQVHMHNYKIVLETPILSDLAYSDCVPKGIAFKNVHHLKNVHFNIWPAAAAASSSDSEASSDSSSDSEASSSSSSDDDSSGGDSDSSSDDSDSSTSSDGDDSSSDDDGDEQLFCCNDDHFGPVHDIFEGISGVHFLKLEGDSLKAIQRCQNLLPTFQHMIELELKSDLGADHWKLLPMLLSKSPHLRALTFGFTRGYCRDVSGSFHPAENLPNCLLHHLRIVKINKFYGLGEDLSIVEYFLDKARVLEKLVIRCGQKSSKMEISSKLLMLPRTSRCRIMLL